MDRRLPNAVFRVVLASSVASGLSGLAWAAEAPDFNRQVRPILARNCFACHGPDDKQREAGLRLDTAAGATGRLESGHRAIVPGDAAASALLARIRSTDPDDVMPPPATKKKLSAAEQEVLAQWIAAGAPYQPHWAFGPPRQRPWAAVRDPAWLRGPLDGHVRAAGEAAGLAPAPPANRETLVRRVYLDTVGMPPSPEEADEFLQDAAPDAYERLVDRLLAAPAYGERWARRWLDLARYADTNGYEKDRPRSVWPYRDWVIQALNADLPFDQFTIEQLAGDMLPNATLAQRIATGFHRNTMINEEGGIDPLEFRYYAMVDRVNTTGTTWLGLTLVCANCHTHKFDPVPQQEYFQLMALLNNADELEMDVALPDLVERRQSLERQIAAREADLAAQFPPAGELTWEIVAPRSVTTAGEATAQIQPDRSVLVSGVNPERDKYTVEFETKGEPITALRLETLTDPSLGGGGPGRTPHGNFVLTELTARIVPAPAGGAAKPVALVRPTAEIEQPMFPVTAAVDGKSDTGWAIHHPQQPLNQPRWAVFQVDPPVAAPAGNRWILEIDQQFGRQHTIGRFRISVGRLTRDDRPWEVRRREHLQQKFREWVAAESSRASRWTVLQPETATSNLPVLTILDDASILASGDQSKSDLYELTLRASGRPITAIRIDALPDDSLPKHGPGRVYYEGPHGDFWLSDISVGSRPPGQRAETPPVAHRLVKASHSFAAANSSAAASIDDNKQTGWSINGGQGRPHSAVFNLAEPIVDAERLTVRLLFERYYAAGLGRFRISVTDDPDAVASSLPPDVELALATPEAERSAADRDRLLRHFLAVAPELAAARQDIERLRGQLVPLPTTLVFQERPAENPRPTFRHHRGEFLQPKEPVQGDVLKLLPPLPAAAPRNRLSLARWIVSPENPLVGRVTMNRHWAALFGRGIVRTTEDFGYQGEPPTNQLLLDWLAVELVRQGWSIKAMHRQIVTSTTYRQSSDCSGEQLARDPHNELLARGPRVRLEAELLRDSVLKISGLLSHRIGGPSVFPPQPSNVTTEGAYGQLNWQTSGGGDRYRRGLYTFAKRTAPYAMFTTFDGPSGEACVARREVSNTPLQALTLLNDSVLWDAARELGRNAAAWQPDELGLGGPPTEPARLAVARLERLVRTCLTRRPTADETELLVRFQAAQRERFAAGQLDATQFAGDSGGDAVDRAAWTAVARVLLNVDEMVIKN